MKTGNKLKIGIVHYRVGLTDGVSLEIAKRVDILESLGHEVKLISGHFQTSADFIIKELEFDDEEIKEIKENSFKHFKKQTISPQHLTEKIQYISDNIEKQFYKIQKEEQFDFILIHNIYSIALHIPATIAFYKIAKSLKVNFISTNHDYYWERPNFQEPTSILIQDYLKRYFPPNLNNIVHVSINTIAQKELKRRKGINSLVIPDVFDFDQNPWGKDSFNSDLLARMGINDNDLIILQATRIVKRKGIETTIQFVKELDRLKKQLFGQKLYNGKKINRDSDVTLLLAGFAEKFDYEYLRNLENEIERVGIKANFISDSISTQRKNENGQKVYSLWDSYAVADLVTYPSIFEGWGNQFIEAVFAKKPIVVFEYPVYKADIKPEGYNVISLGDKYTYRKNRSFIRVNQINIRMAAQESINVLISDSTNEIVENNFKIGAKYHGYNILSEFYDKLTNNILENKENKYL